MRKFIITLIALFLIPNLVLGASPTLVQSDQEYTGSSSSEAFNSNVTSGNFIIVKVADGKTSTGTAIGDPTVSDTKHPYIKINGNTWLNGTRNNSWTYCAIATSTTALTVSVTRGAAGTDMGFIIEEWAGVTNATCLDIATSSKTVLTSSTTWTGDAVNAPADSTVSVHINEHYATSNPTNQNGYTTSQHIGGQFSRSVYQAFSVASSTVAWFTSGVSNPVNFQVLVLQGASSGEPTATPTVRIKNAIIRLIGAFTVR